MHEIATFPLTILLLETITCSAADASCQSSPFTSLFSLQKLGGPEEHLDVVHAVHCWFRGGV